MILGAGAVGMVIETDTAAQARPGRGKSRAKVLAAVHANSAFHASAIGTAHATSLLDGMLRQVKTHPPINHALSTTRPPHSAHAMRAPLRFLFPCFKPPCNVAARRNAAARAPAPPPNAHAHTFLRSHQSPILFLRPFPILLPP
jgi:hypothetical protein